METHYGFKRITEENWLELDATMALFGTISGDGRFCTPTGEDWVKMILAPQLSSSVPEEVCKLFEVARGSLVYGCCFYPLFTLAEQQLFRIVETAVMLKCKALGVPNGVRGFQNGVEFLIKNGVILKTEAERWNAVVKLRNLTSHPMEQSIVLPGQAITSLKHAAEAINSLF